MRAMRDSGAAWIGEVPAGWEMTKLSAMARMCGGATPSKDRPEYWDGEIPWVSSKEVKADVLHDTSLHISKEGLNSCNTVLVPEGSYVIVVRSGILKHTLPIARLARPMAINQDIKALTFTDELSARYFFYFVRGLNDSLLLEFKKDGTTVDNLDISKFFHCPVPVPPENEQRRIAEWLDERCADIDAAVEAARASIDEYEAYKKSVISHAVTRGLDPDVGSGDWPTIQFKYVARVCANLVQPSDYPELMEIDPENIEKNSGRIVNVRTVEEVGAISAKHLFHEGQILYSKIRPTLNKVTVAPYDGLCSADMYPIETSQNVRWLMYAMLSTNFVEQVALECARVKMPKINVLQLGQIKLRVPPLPEQRRIAAYLDSRTAAIDAVVAQKRAIVEDLLAYKKSLIYEAVTGKREV